MRIASQEGASPRIIVVVDLDVDSDNDGAIADADDPIEDDAGRPGKAIPVNQDDGDADGIPDFADGFDLNGYGGGYQQNALELSMVPVRLTLAGFPDPNRVRLKFDYPASDPGAVTRDTAEPGSMFIFRSDPDPPVLYKYTKGGGPMRVWRVPGNVARHPATDFLNPGASYTPAQIGVVNGVAALYLEGISEAEKQSVTCTAEVEVAPGQWVPFTEDRMLVTVADLNVNVNTNNDPSFVHDAGDNDIEDQFRGFRFWPTRDSGDEITGMGAVDLMPIEFRVPQSLLGGGFRFFVDAIASGPCAIDFYENKSQADTLDYVHLQEAGNDQVAAARLFRVTGYQDPKLLSMKSTTGRFLIRFHDTGLYFIRFWAAGPTGLTPGVLADSVRITVSEPQRLYWYGSMRGSQSGNGDFEYPLDSGTVTMTDRFPDVHQPSGCLDNRLIGENRKYLVFLHGFHISSGDAAEWNDELFKRLYWTGYRDNYIGLTWPGDWGWPGFIEPAFFFHDVELALHSSPSLYRFLRNTVLGSWNVPVGDVYLMAHSLGNLVAWDALRINQREHPGSQIVNNFIGVQAAVWPEILFPEQNLTYASPGPGPQENDPPGITYTVGQLRRNSWAFWVQQAGHEALTSLAGGYYHSFVELDKALHAMRWWDSQAHPKHYNRALLPTDRDVDSLNGIPALINDGMRHWNDELPRVYVGDLHLPLGCVGSLLPPGASAVAVPATDRRNPVAEEWGWGSTAHSDFRTQPLFTIYEWYKRFIRPSLGMAP